MLRQKDKTLNKSKRNEIDKKAKKEFPLNPPPHPHPTLVSFTPKDKAMHNA